MGVSASTPISKFTSTTKIARQLKGGGIECLVNDFQTSGHRVALELIISELKLVFHWANVSPRLFRKPICE